MDPQQNFVAIHKTIPAWTRRTTLHALVGFLCAGAWAGSSDAQPPSPLDQDPPDVLVDVRWELRREYAADAARYLDASPSQIIPAPRRAQRGPPVFVLIVGAFLLIKLAQALVAIYRDLRYGGLIIQDTGHGVSIRHDRSIPGHVIIIKDRNGVTIRELHGDVEVRDLARLLPQARAAPAR